MVVKNYITQDYPAVDAFSGASSVAEILLNTNYVVLFKEGIYEGILTPSDLIERPHKLAIDCLTPKSSLTNEDSIFKALFVFSQHTAEALAVFSGEQFMGIIEKWRILHSWHQKIDQLLTEVQITDKFKKNILKNLSHEVRTP